MADPVAERLAAIHAYVHDPALTDGPWWFDESEDCWRLHGSADWIPPLANGMIPAQIVNKQIFKAPKHGTPYAEYWPERADGEFIVRARTDLPLLLDVLEAVLAVEPSMHQDHGPVPGECRFCAGEAAALRRVQEVVNIQLLDGTKEDSCG